MRKLHLAAPAKLNKNYMHRGYSALKF